MAAPIRQFFAPTQELRSSPAAAAAFETAARRIGPDYQAVAQNERAMGQIAADLFKQNLWPMNVAKLYEQRTRDETIAAASDAKKLASQNIRFVVRGAQTNFGGPTETFSEDPTQDFQPTRANPTGLSTGEEATADMGHLQVSRGAGALGRALRDGGYALASMTGNYPGQQEIDPITGLPVHPRDYTAFNKAQAAARALNEKETLLPAQQDYEHAIAMRDYNARYEGYNPYSTTGPDTPFNVSGTPVYQAGQAGYQEVKPEDTSYFQGLSNFISNLSGGTSTDTTGGM